MSENDRQALEVGYVEDAARVDVQRFGKYAPGQDCYGCDLYRGDRSQPWAPCTLFPRRVVSGKGWCDAYRTRRR